MTMNGITPALYMTSTIWGFCVKGHALHVALPWAAQQAGTAMCCRNDTAGLMAFHVYIGVNGSFYIVLSLRDETVTGYSGKHGIMSFAIMACTSVSRGTCHH